MRSLALPLRLQTPRHHFSQRLPLSTPEPVPGTRDAREFFFSKRTIGLIWGAFLLAFLGRHGFRLDDPTWLRVANALDITVGLAIAVDLILGLRRSVERAALLRRYRADFALLVALLLGLAALAGRGEFNGLFEWASLAASTIVWYSGFSLTLRLLRALGEWLGRGIPTEVLLIGSFVSLIVLGTVLLLLPGAHATGAAPLTIQEALFTSTSASCVTGLALFDTGTKLSLFGQGIVMFLFQVGGLGIITFVGFGTLLSSRRFSIPQVVTLREVLGATSNKEAYKSVYQVIGWALAVEGLGCIALYSFLPTDWGHAGERWFWSLFHSISAFCNAGFSLQADSLEGLRSNGGINFTIMGLIIFGGLGMPVARELLSYHFTRNPLFRRFTFFRRLHDGKLQKPLSLQTKLSLWMTLALLFIGFVGFWLLESGALLEGAGTFDSALVSAFQSVTTRTAGFNTVHMGEMQEGTKVLFLGLMTIGAGPVSTGGGLKTVTFAVLLITLRAMVSGRKNIEVAGRSLPRLIVRTAISVFVLYVLAAGVTSFLLAVSDPQIPFIDRTFEAISALSTVGLSTGVTTEFSLVGQFVLCLTMFIGRVGPLALTLSVFRSRQKNVSLEYPEENLIVS